MKFSKSHEWASLEGEVATIGISSYAQEQLGDIVFIELPKKGEILEQGTRFGTIESTKTASEVYSPLSGEVIEINNDLINNPQWVNESAHEKGWMVKLRVSNVSELEGLMEEGAYAEFVAEEAH